VRASSPRLGAALAALAMLAMLGCEATAQSTSEPEPADEQTAAPAATPAPAAAPAPAPAPVVQSPRFAMQTLGTEKAPRIAGDWVVCTRDAVNNPSPGTVVARDLATGKEYEIGPGFLPDVDVYAPGEGGGAGVPAPGAEGAASVVRVAFLRLHEDGRLSLQDAIFTGAGWEVAELVPDLGCADRPRVCGNWTAWTATDDQGRLRVHLHDGREVTRPSGESAHAFRPELARSADGGFALVWDEYRGATPTALDYEVCGSFRPPGGTWSAPASLSAAPLSLDASPAVAPAADGGWWLAWESDRGALFSHVVVAHRAADGALALAREFPASETGSTGIVDLAYGLSTTKPVLAVDGDGRPWLIVENKVLGQAALTFDKRLFASVYGDAGWSEPVLLPGEMWGEKSADAVAAGGDALRVVYQSNTSATKSLDVALLELHGGGPARGPAPLAAAGAPAPALPHPAIELPQRRDLDVDEVPYRLAFADLHSHCGQSPDGMGERDHALFWARDMVRIDVWASTDHDEAQHEPFLDWEYELARRFVDLFDSADFTTFMGFEWSNHEHESQGEIIGHRATFASRKCYRYTDPAFDELSEYYAAMRAEDAIGVPHHLGKFGGSSFLEFDPVVQPVTEVTSGHGQFEDLLVSKLVGNGVRFGVTAAGDDHLATPGTKGLAGVYYDTRLPSRREAIKQALRARRCFGVARHGLYADFRIEGRPMGAELEHAGELLLTVRVSELPDETHGRGPLQPVHVTVCADGDHEHPVWSRVVPPGEALDEIAVLPGRDADAFYMLRVSRGARSTDPKDTLLWSSPIWVAAGSGAGLSPEGTAGSTTR